MNNIAKYKRKQHKYSKNKEYYEANKSFIHLKHKIYKSKNKSKIDDIRKAYRFQNQDSIKQYDKDRYRKRKRKMQEDSIGIDFESRKLKLQSNIQQSSSNQSSRQQQSQNDSNAFNFYTISSTSSPDEIRFALSQHMTQEGKKMIESKLAKVKERFLKSSFVDDDPGIQQANVCIICDELIIGMEEVCWLPKDQIILNYTRLSVDSYELHYRIELPEMLKKQYEVIDEPDLKGLLLSPRARRSHGKSSFSCCASCNASIGRGCKGEVLTPPKFAIANGFVIGSVPDKLEYTNKKGVPVSVPINVEEQLDDMICATISPVRPFGYIHGWSGGKQKSLTGHFSLFSVDQSHVGGVLNKYKNVGNAEMQPSKNVFVVLCGRMTPGQKKEARRQAELDTDLFLHLLNWFVRTSKHRGYEGITPPDECPDMIAFLEDEDTENNTDDPVDETVECRVNGKTYYFSDHAQKPNGQTSIFDATPQFVKSMLENEKPTLFMYGGNYLKSHEINLEDAFPIQFPFGLGAPDHGVTRQVPVSEEACYRHYMRLSLRQFMRPDFILVCYHMLCRSMSYETGLIKCRSNYKGTSLAEKVAGLTVADVEKASSDLTFKQHLNESLNVSGCAADFLKSVTTSCKVLGHTTQAAKDARRKMYALTERFGPHSIFLTVTPDDECTFKVRMYSLQGKPVNLPSVDCSDEDCFLDFLMRTKTRTKYPGACSLFYQSAIQCIYELLGWDPIHNRSKGVGIFGPVKAIGRADEEQGRHTLHGHILVWLENFAEVCNLLFSEDEEVRESARECLRQFIDNHFNSDYEYDKELRITHQECGKSGTIDDMFFEAPPQDLHDCRDKDLCQEFEGKILCCRHCSEHKDQDPKKSRVSPPELRNMVLQSYQYQQRTDEGDSSNVVNENSTSVTFPPNRYRSDILTYRKPIDDLDANSTNFYQNEKARDHVAISHMNNHDYNHRGSCFKYSCSCRMRLPKLSKQQSEFVVDNTNIEKCTTWRYLEQPSEEVYPYTIESKRGLGSQYLNTHNKTISSILACNNNIQMGSPRCLFYVVHYSTKSTQKEDKGVNFERIGYQIIRRIEREQKRLEEEQTSEYRVHNSEINDNKNDKDTSNIHNNDSKIDNNNSMNDHNNDNAINDNERKCFREGLCRFLLGMTVHMSQDVISATMAHLLISQNCARFTFSHDFKDLLLGQMLNHLNGKEPGDFVLKRNNINEKEKPEMWPDYSINDYIFRASELEEVSFYQFCAEYDKAYFTFEQMKNRNEEGLPMLDPKNGMYFTSGHPGRRYCYLKKAKKQYVPKVSSPKGIICDLEMLELDVDNDTEVNEVALEMREDYARYALILFCPFRGQELFSLDETNYDCLWKKFMTLVNADDGDNSFWKEGKKILQYTQDRIQSTKTRLPADELEATTEARKVERSSKQYNDQRFLDDDQEWDDASSVGDYSDEDDFQSFDIPVENTKVRKLNDLKKGHEMKNDDVISPRLGCKASIFHSYDEKDNGTNSTNIIQDRENSNTINQSYGTLLAFASGAAVGSRSTINFQDVDSDDLTMHSSHYLNDEIQINESDWSQLGLSSDLDKCYFPTIKGVALKVSKEQGIVLDRIQYVAYKIICASFILNLINEGWNNKLVSGSNFAINGDTTEDINSTEKDIKDKICTELKEIGGKDQLIMFVTGPAGAGKSTSLEVAQYFCFDFSRAVKANWDDTTFLFTALTGCAASIFSGITTHSAAWLNTRDSDKITNEMMSKWDNVRVVVVDEVSMAKKNDMNKLNEHLNLTRRRRQPNSHHISSNMIFGGYSIIFSGDFHQIPAVRATEKDFLYNGHCLWERAINVAIILTNSHRFKDDPEYGEILMRIWKGNLNNEDRNTINKRLVGLNGLKMPDVTNESDIAYACPKNDERVLVQAEVFQKHISTFPLVTSDDLPPEHTLIIEADIQKAPKMKETRKQLSDENREDARPQSISVSDRIRERIYSRCGDADMKCGTKHVDPALKLYVGAHCMITDNDNLAEGRANGTLCRVVSVKRRDESSPLQWTNYDGKKVYTMNVKDIEYVEFEHFPPNFIQKQLKAEILNIENSLRERRFKLNDADNVELKHKHHKLLNQYEVITKKRCFQLKPKSYYCIFDKNRIIDEDEGFRLRGRVKLKRRNCKVKVVQLPVNLNDATTGHKLQGMTKQQLIIRSWTYSPGWIYTNLSRVRTLNGLFLMEALKPRRTGQPDSVTLSTSLQAFEHRIRQKIPEEAIIE